MIYVKRSIQILKNRIFPYDYWDSLETFKDLPSKEKFYNSLINRTYSNKIMNMFLTFRKVSEYT